MRYWYSTKKYRQTLGFTYRPSFFPIPPCRDDSGDAHLVERMDHRPNFADLIFFTQDHSDFLGCVRELETKNPPKAWSSEMAITPAWIRSLGTWWFPDGWEITGAWELGKTSNDLNGGFIPWLLRLSTRGQLCFGINHPFLGTAPTCACLNIPISRQNPWQFQ